MLSITEPSNTANAAPAPYSYTLSATVRPQGQAAPTGGATAGFPSLLALGGCTPDSSYKPGVSGSGGSGMTVNGPTVINGTNTSSPPCNLLSTSGGATFSASPPASFSPSGLLDPYLTMPPPNDPGGNPFSEQADCLNGSNPATTTVGGVVHYHPGVYQQTIGVTTNVVFDPGVYFFCTGVSVSGHGVVSANGVLFYFAQGALTISGANTQVTMSGLASGPDAGFVIWMPRTNTTTTLGLSGQTTVSQYNGVIYVPNVDVTLTGGSGIQIGAIICRTLSYSGGQGTHVGPYTPTVGSPNPTSGAPGIPVSISGSGFVANSPITVALGATTATITSGAATDANGNVSVIFTVPALSPGNYTVSVTDGGSNTATSGTQFTVLPAFGPATRLVFSRQPSNSSPNTAFPTQPRITVQDASGNTVTNDASIVTLAISGGTPTSGGPGTLSGCTQTETLGVITFSGCKIDTAGSATSSMPPQELSRRRTANRST